MGNWCGMKEKKSIGTIPEPKYILKFQKDNQTKNIELLFIQQVKHTINSTLEFNVWMNRHGKVIDMRKIKHDLKSIEYHQIKLQYRQYFIQLSNVKRLDESGSYEISFEIVKHPIKSKFPPPFGAKLNIPSKKKVKEEEDGKKKDNSYRKPKVVEIMEIHTKTRENFVTIKLTDDDDAKPSVEDGRVRKSNFQN